MAQTGPLLLACDDGWQAPGFAAMIRQLEKVDCSIRVAATEKSWPSFGTATGLGAPSELDLLTPRYEKVSNTEVSILQGYPATLARYLTARSPDACGLIAGVNPGPNVGIDLVHSGTFCLALVANWLGLPSLAVSLDDVYSVDEENPGEAQFEAASRAAVHAWHAMQKSGHGWLVNINFPNSQTSEKVRFSPSCPYSGSVDGESDKCVLSEGKASITVFAPRSLNWLQHESGWLAEYLNNDR